MSDSDAYQDEMGLLGHDIDGPEFSSLVEEIRAAYRRVPDPSVEARHMAAIVEQAQASRIGPTLELARERKPMRLVRIALKLGVAAAGLGLVTGGLALAGVDLPLLPDQASDKAREAVAKHQSEDAESDAGPSVDQLPESAGDTAVAVVGTIETNLPMLQAGDLSGCEFGAMVSAAARGVEPDTSHCKDEGSDDEGPSVDQLPENASDTAKRVIAAIEANLPLLQSGEISGCEFGAMVSAAARGVDPDTSRCERADEDSGDITGAGKKSKGTESSAQGRARADEAKAEGQAKGAEASGGKAKGGESSSGAGAGDTADEASGGKSKAGSDQGAAASGGKSNAGGNPNDD